MVEHVVAEGLRWIFRRVGDPDTGIDAQFEVVSSDGKATGYLLAAQIKCGRSYVAKRSAEGIPFRPDRAHSNYWLRYSLPVIVVLCDPASDKCWWVEVTDETVRLTEKNGIIVVPDDQPFDLSAKQALQALAKLPRPLLRPTREEEELLVADEDATEESVAPATLRAVTTHKAERITLTTGEELGEPPYTYTIESAAELQMPGETAAPLGVGGAGVVFRALFKGSMPRAIKLLSPDPELLRGIDPEAFRVSFEAEEELLSRLTHTRVSKLADFGTLSLHGEERLFYAMDLIRGHHLDKALAAGDLNAREFLEVIDQLLDAIAYLHSELVMHCDVKGSNVLVARTGRGWQSTLVDLGTAKVIKDDGGEGAPEPHDPSILERLGDVTTFNSTRRLMRPEWRDRLFRKIPYDQLREMFPSHDLYAVGLLIDSALNAEGPMGAKLQHELGPDVVAGMRAIRDRLLAPAGAEYYRRTEHLRDDWRKLDPGYMAPLDVAELATGGSGMTSFPLPSGRALLTPRAVAAISHPLMQRLRHIPQLELVSLLNPGATHTRLLHAVSTFEVAKQVVISLLGDPLFRLMAEPLDVEAALLWALVHDVGQYPLSHMFEDLAEEQRKFGRPRTIPTADDLFFAFIAPARVDTAFTEFTTAIEGAFAESDAQPKTPLPQHLCDVGFSEETLQAMWGIAQRDTPARAVLSAMLSSPIDVAKIAYLGDDSRTTGVDYGLGRDLDGLLSSLRAPAEDDIKLGKPLLAITDKGLPAAEQIVLARYWMLRRVYWHKTNRSIIGMIKFVIRELLAADQLSMPRYIGAHLFADADTALRYLSVRFEKAAEAGSLAEGLPMRNPLPGLLGGNRALYKELLGVGDGPGGVERGLQARLAELRPDEQPHILGEMEDALRRVVGSEIRRGDLILDIPTKAREKLGAPVIVYPDRTSHHGLPLYEASPLLASHAAGFALHVKRSRVFVHPQLAADLGDRVDVAHDAVQQILLARFSIDDVPG